MRCKRLVLGAVVVAASFTPVLAAAPAVDLELVIAADTSSSIDDREAALEREGVASAFRSADVLRAISSGSLGRIAVLYLDWSGGPNNKIIVNWTTIHDKASAEAFAATLMRAPRTYGRGTSIGGAIEMGAALIESSGVEATRKAIDISGDGPANTGRPVADARDEIVGRGIVINGLPIMSGDYGTGDWGAYPGQLDQYYMHCVIGGQGSFIVPARGFQEFVVAMRRKLALEISDSGWRPKLVKAAAQTGNPLRAQKPPAQDCGSGEDIFRGGFRGGFGRF